VQLDQLPKEQQNAILGEVQLTRHQMGFYRHDDELFFWSVDELAPALTPVLVVGHVENL
jgi:hypothetical protein